MKNDFKVIKKIFINYGTNNRNKHQSWIPDLSLAIETVEISLENWYIDVHNDNNS